MKQNNLRLALTKVGDILIEDKITISEDGSAIGNLKLDIPEYQRPYKWTPKNVYQLIDDIEEALSSNKEVYRLGTLILHHDKDKYFIVDGQQRTITLALLLHALNKKLQIPILDCQISKNIITLNSIHTNYNAIKRRVGNGNEELAKYVKENCELVVIITNDLSEAFQFFDSQNARGKKLYPHDLLKAYHLREMGQLPTAETEELVKVWESKNQRELAELFNDYLYRLKAWTKGNRAYELNEGNIEIFKGVSEKDNYPYAQFYKAAHAYADNINHSMLPFVTGSKLLRAFQINAPIIAGKPFFEYADYYFRILDDIRDNDKYKGYFINGNEIVKTLDLHKWKYGVGNRITRMMFDTAILLYVDRFCPDIPSKTDLDLLEQFVVSAFVWAYSMRAQYYNVGWKVAQNYILGISADKVKNAMNIYKLIEDAPSPSSLLSQLSKVLVPLRDSEVVANKENLEEEDKDEVTGAHLNYMFFLKNTHYLVESNE